MIASLRELFVRAGATPGMLCISALCLLMQPTKASISIPFELNSGKIYIRAELNGADERWLILDAGSRNMILDSSLCDALGLNTSPLGDLQGQGANSFPASRVDGTVVARFDDLVVRTTHAIAGPLNRVVGPYEGRQVNGVLGVRDVFQRYTVEIDYQGRRLRLHEPAAFHYEGQGQVVQLTNRNMRMLAQATLRLPDGSEVEGEFLVDTGMRGAVILHSEFVREHRLLERFGDTVRAVKGGGIGGRAEFQVARSEALSVGPVTVPSIVVWMTDPDGEMAQPRSWSGVIGSAFLQRFRAFFDIGGGRLILEPAEFDAQSVRDDRSGMFVITDGEGRHRVIDVVDNSPAHDAGIQVGDLLVSIQGEPIRSLEHARHILRGEIGERVTVGTRRSGEHRSAVVVLREIV